MLLFVKQLCRFIPLFGRHRVVREPSDESGGLDSMAGALDPMWEAPNRVLSLWARAAIG